MNEEFKLLLLKQRTLTGKLINNEICTWGGPVPACPLSRHYHLSHPVYPSGLLLYVVTGVVALGINLCWQTGGGGVDGITSWVTVMNFPLSGDYQLNQMVATYWYIDPRAEMTQKPLTLIPWLCWFSVWCRNLSHVETPLYPYSTISTLSPGEKDDLKSF